ncbi:MAG: hypothetical protein M1833_000464 [Piccolia ochrophora]|nr:MAG: hypothetical protein M1833_000464 [Piccolia ochrophora]
MGAAGGPAAPSKTTKPASAAVPSKVSTTPTAPLTPQLRSDINAAMIAGGHIEKIQTYLLAALQSTGWQASVRSLCLEMLRNGEASDYGVLLKRIREECRRDGGKCKVEAKVVDEGIGVVREVLGGVVNVVEPDGGR